MSMNRRLFAAVFSTRKLYHEVDAINTRDTALEEGLDLCNFEFHENWFEYKYPDGHKLEDFEIEERTPNRTARGLLFLCPENRRWYAGYDFWNKDHGYCTAPKVPFSPSFSERRDAEEWIREKWCKFIGKKYERKAIQLDLFGGIYE